ncbi:hypothetical protein SCLCIDRAFT_265765 [Scleroderma citrinum Foug A]|uniref:Uncharacterized protein n=1 Tax=Scleroderma citrinum Foug A TaxID=1036808 RepID=A0A0C3DIB7_9AGAM|nr:hypothetical protein SCLCIDRAFT_265765 [Scleroderma citrinum Foug A]
MMFTKKPVNRTREKQKNSPKWPCLITRHALPLKNDDVGSETRVDDTFGRRGGPKQYDIQGGGRIVRT